VSEPVQPGLERGGVKPLPVGQQGSQPRPRNTPLPPAAVIGDQSRGGQTPAQVVKRRIVKLHPDRFHRHR